MRKKPETEDELRKEYDLKALRVVRVGPGRRPGARTVALDSDVAAMFPTSQSVNEALRLLIRAAKQPGKRNLSQP